jgi:hypothetical protein
MTHALPRDAGSPRYNVKHEVLYRNRAVHRALERPTLGERAAGVLAARAAEGPGVSACECNLQVT